MVAETVGSLSGERHYRFGDCVTRQHDLYLIADVVFGAILLTGYLGGAVATHVRVQEGWFSIIFAVIFGVLLWGGLWLRDERLQKLIPLRS